ncbi:hypothetical protein NY08_2363 [Rhodococcus sp. B7740]|nr:hypothetical protein NY08_2363 [Rhodococcus sp. B7740]
MERPRIDPRPAVRAQWSCGLGVALLREAGADQQSPHLG